MTVDEIKEFVQIRTPDKAALANYISRAKGSDRTMAQFAEECEVSAPTLSRIVNGKITKPLSTDMIIKIFEKRAEKEDEYLLEALARANGLCPKDYAERATSNSYAHKRNEELSRSTIMKNAIVTSVLSNGFPIKKISNSWFIRPGSEAPAIYPNRRIDFSLIFDENEDNSKFKLWSFFVYPYSIEDEENENEAIEKKHVMNNILDKVSRFFLMDAWYPESLSNMKTSFVFSDRDLFYSFVEAFEKAKLNNEMTAILVDTGRAQVEKEVWIPGEYEQLTQVSIFDFDPISFENQLLDFERSEEF